MKRAMLFVAAVFCASTLAYDAAHAATNQGPNPDDFSQSTRYGNDWSGTVRRIDYVVATSAYNYIPTTRVKIFMPTSSGAIVVHNKNICYGTFRNGGDNFDLPDDADLKGSSGNAVSYSVNGGAVQWGAWDAASTCDTKTITFNVSGAALDPNTNMYLYTLTATANASAAKY